eukprot:GHVU01041149.1.p1 GENE.GHVU01041149.1~~GHVU01041149.1.p1  ORF type:complete len:151 (+),score=37.63 GHVU01041149.1:3-455(+)
MWGGAGGSVGLHAVAAAGRPDGARGGSTQPSVAPPLAAAAGGGARGTGGGGSADLEASGALTLTQLKSLLLFEAGFSEGTGAAEPGSGTDAAASAPSGAGAGDAAAAGGGGGGEPRGGAPPQGQGEDADEVSEKPRADALPVAVPGAPAS